MLLVFGGMFAIGIKYDLAAPPQEFEKTTLTSSLNQPTAFRFLPDGRILIAEKAGAIKIYQNGQLSTDPLITLVTLQTNGADERGLLGLEPDPDFATNGYLYVSYTTAQNYDRLSRFTVTGNSADPASELVLLQSNQLGNVWHHGGEVRFGPDGKLYWAMGVNTVYSNAQNLTNVHGKLHRINKDGTIPADNPFVNTPGVLPSIYAYGLRNPFRFDFLPNGKVIVGDVGGSKWEEVNIIEKGANYGWPDAEGICSGCSYANPVFAYPHSPAPANAGSITSALVYSGSTFPSQYLHAFFYGDYTLKFIKYIVFDENYQSVLSDNMFDSNAGTVVQLSQGPDGNIYQLNFYPGTLSKIALSGGNRAPQAAASANPIAGLAPMDVTFSSAGTNDPDNDPITYLWNFGDGTTSTDPNPTHGYTVNGTYNVTLTVSDGSKQGTASVTVTVGNRLPTGTITSPTEGSKYNAGNTINYSGEGTDLEDGTLPDSAFSWRFIFHHNIHTHPFLSVVNGVKSGSFQIPTVADNASNTWYEVELTVTDSGGLKHVSSTNIYPNLINLTINANIPGLQFTIDGIPSTSNFSEQAVVGVERVLSVPSPQFINGQEYRFISWSDGQAKTHSIFTPNTDTIYTANLIAVGEVPSPWQTTDVGNPSLTGAGKYISSSQTFVVEGAGDDIWYQTDQFKYVYQTLSGDGEIIARVTSQDNTDPWAKAGVMIKESTTPLSKYAMFGVTPSNGYAFQYNFTSAVNGAPYTPPNAWVKLSRSGNTFTSYKSTDGVNWTIVGSADISMATDVTMGLFVTSHQGGMLGTAMFDNVSVKNTLSTPWINTDIGSPTIAGSAKSSNGIFTLKGAGNDIWNQTDQLQYVYQPLYGDGEISARVTSQTNTDGWAKAGVMIKESTTPLSKYALMGVTPANGYAFQYNFNGNTNGAAYSFPNVWVKLKRSGNTFTSFRSIDGVNWTQAGTTTLNMTETASAGLFVTSHNGSALSAAIFDNVSFKNFLPSPWANTDIGFPQTAGSAKYASGTFTIKGAGADIWGTTDQFQYSYQTLTGDGSIVARIKSQENTDGWAKAGVMIKESTIPLSKYVTMGISPTNGYVFQNNFNGNINGAAYTFPNAWVKLTRTGNTFNAYRSVDGINWVQYGTTTLAMQSQVTIGLSVLSHNSPITSTVQFDNVLINGTAVGTLPAPWVGADIGSPVILGSSSYNNGVFTLSGSGNDIWGTTDQLRYVYRNLAGNGSVVARISSQDNTDSWAKSGVMIKESTIALSTYAMLAATPGNGLAFQSNFNFNQSGGTFTSPVWLKLTRVGNVITSYKSTDGVNWTQVGTRTVAMNTNVTIGLFVTAHNGSQLNTSTFDNVTFTQN